MQQGKNKIHAIYFAYASWYANTQRKNQREEIQQQFLLLLLSAALSHVYIPHVAADMRRKNSQNKFERKKLLREGNL